MIISNIEIGKPSPFNSFVEFFKQWKLYWKSLAGKFPIFTFHYNFIFFLIFIIVRFSWEGRVFMEKISSSIVSLSLSLWCDFLRNMEYVRYYSWQGIIIIIVNIILLYFSITICLSLWIFYILFFASFFIIQVIIMSLIFLSDKFSVW